MTSSQKGKFPTVLDVVVSFLGDVSYRCNKAKKNFRGATTKTEKFFSSSVLFQAIIIILNISNSRQNGSSKKKNHIIIKIRKGESPERKLRSKNTKKYVS